MSANPAQTATVTIKEVVFEAETLNSLIGATPGSLGHDDSIQATGEEVAKLLLASFSNWIDFLYVPSPKPFVIYADHDEYATFYANSKSGLNQVTIALRDSGFSIVESWKRTF